MKRRLRYVMVGGGNGSFIGPVHRMALRMDDSAELVAGCFSRDAAVNAETGATLGLPPERVYADWREMFAAEKGSADFAAVCTPNDSHCEIACAAMGAGMDVMCEKPLSLTLAEAQRLAVVARRRRRIVGVPFTYTGYPMAKLARDLVRGGELGRIDRVTLEYVQGSFRKLDFTRPLDKRNAWKTDPRRSGPSCAVADIGVHAFTLVEYVTGLEARSLLADLSSFAIGGRLDDDASIIMRLSKGARATVVVSKVATGEENGVRLRVYGDKASLFWDQESPNALTVRSPFAPDRVYRRNAPYVRSSSAASAMASRIPAGHHEGFIEAVANIYGNFCAAVADRRPHDFTGIREGLRAMRFVDAALRSGAGGGAWTEI